MINMPSTGALSVRGLLGSASSVMGSGFIALVLTLMPAASAHAQCSAGWSSIASVPAHAGLAGSLVLPSGDVIVAGTFSIAGSSNIARYNPTANTWSALGSGVSGSVYAMMLVPGGDLIAAGDFTAAGGAPANRIARFNFTTNSWSPLGTGTNNIVYGVAMVPNGDIIAGGTFTTAGGIAVNKVARFNPVTNTWSAMGSGVVGGSTNNAVINAVVSTPGGDVIVAGDFYGAGGVGAGSIARYNPATGVWSRLGGGPGNVVIYSLAVLPGGDVITGGDSAFVGGGAATLIARCNLTTNAWTGLGAYAGGLTTGLKVLPSGDLIATGTWTTAAGLTANRIIKYNPGTNTWATLGSGVAAGVPLTNVGGVAPLNSGDLLVTGRFTIAGGIAANDMARYSFASPAPGITSQPANATTCLSDAATFSVAASGTSPTYQWQWQPEGPGTGWVALSNGINTNNQGTRALLAADVTLSDMRIQATGSFIDDWRGQMAQVRCIVTANCGSVTSNAASLHFCRCLACPADFNQDGGIDGADVGEFFAAWEGGGCDGDANADGGVDGEDVNVFFAAWEAGGC